MIAPLVFGPPQLAASLGPSEHLNGFALTPAQVTAIRVVSRSGSPYVELTYTTSSGAQKLVANYKISFGKDNLVHGVVRIRLGIMEQGGGAAEMRSHKGHLDLPTQIRPPQKLIVENQDGSVLLTAIYTC